MDFYLYYLYIFFFRSFRNVAYLVLYSVYSLLYRFYTYIIQYTRDSNYCSCALINNTPCSMYILQLQPAVFRHPGIRRNIKYLKCYNLNDNKACNKRISIGWRLYFAVIVTQPPTAAHVTCKKNALNASSYIMLYYVAYVLLLGHRRLALPPVECSVCV